jgi:hypothetical protein
VRAAELSTVPLIIAGLLSLPALRELLGRSSFGSIAAEGLYLRWDDGDWLVTRARLVRPDWRMVGDEHWSHGALKTNRLRNAESARFPMAMD